MRDKPSAPDARLRSGGPRSARLLAASGGVMAVLVVAVFNWLFYDHYSPLPEGWFSVYADLIRKGQLPYRDVYFFLPPLYPLFITAVQAVLGPQMIMLRLVGVGLILFSTGVLYQILRSCFEPIVALIATVAGIVYFQSGVAHIAYDFFQLMTLAALLACLGLIRFDRALEEKRGVARLAGWAALTGFCAAVALFTKQSNGLLIAAACAVAVMLAGFRGGRAWAVRGLLWFSVGFGGVAGGLGVWLCAHGSLTACLAMISGGAAAAKGGVLQAFFGFIPSVLTGDLASRILAILILGLPLGFGSIWLLRFEPKKSTVVDGRGSMLTLSAAALGLLTAILLPWSGPVGAVSWISETLVRSVTGSLVPAALLGTGLIVVGYGVAQIRSADAPRARFLTGLVSVGILWGNGTSGGLSEGGAFLGFSLFLGLLLHHGGVFRIGGLVVAVLACLQISIYAEAKFHVPYDWWGVREPDIRVHHEPAHQPLLRGLWVTTERNAVYDRITEIIRRETRPGESIMIFPQTPIFYLLADRPPMGRAVVYWFDFLPDNLAQEEKRRLEGKPPALILLMDLPEIVWTEHEKAFRGGRPSAQRGIVEQIQRMEEQGSYRQIATIPLEARYQFRILKHK